MRVSLSTSGGLAAGLRLGRPPTVVDASALPEEDARRLGELVDAVVAEPPPGGEAGSARDEMNYTFTVDRDGGSGQVIRRSDATMSQAFADLLGFVRERGETPTV